MTSAATTILAAVLGVVVGALSAGSVQGLLARLDRGRVARASARLLYIDLLTASSRVAYVRGSETWFQRGDWEALLDLWTDQRSSLALVLDTKAFHTLSSAIVILDQLKLMREAEIEAAATNVPGPPPVSAGVGPILETAAAIIDNAITIVYTASFTRWERLRGVEDVSIPSAEDFGPEAEDVPPS